MYNEYNCSGLERKLPEKKDGRGKDFPYPSFFSGDTFPSLSCYKGYSHGIGPA